MSKTVSEMQGLTVVIPVFKEDPSIIIRQYIALTNKGAEVIVVDDGNTVDLPDWFNEISYMPNMGYGYAIKRGIEKATNPNIMVMDGDGQHTFSDAQKLWKVFNMIDNCAMLVGSRWNLNEKPIRWIGRKCLNFFASCLAGHYLVDLNSGMRVFRRELAIGYSNILCDTFSFTTSLTMSVVADGHKVAYFPIDVQPRVHGKSHVRVVKDGFVTLFYIIWIGLAMRTRGIREWIRNLRGLVTRN